MTEGAGNRFSSPAADPLEGERPSPLVTVLIPTKDEQRDIQRAISAVLNQDLSAHQIEVLVVDSGSRDGTVAVAEELLRGAALSHAEVLANPGGNTPENLNAGLNAARGQYLCRVDARSVVPRNYLSTCVEVLRSDPRIKVLGGAQRAVARDSSARSIGIARALNNRWGMGFSRYRRGAGSGPSDTVYLGAFRTAELRSVGGWDARLGTNQDFDLNRRLGREGVVWFDSTIPVGYLPRDTHGDLLRQYHRFGKAKVQYWFASREVPQRRQIVLLAVPLLLVIAQISLHRRGFTRAALLAVASALFVEAIGSDEPKGSPSAHLHGVLALAAVAGGWTAGVWQGLANCLLDPLRSRG